MSCHIIVILVGFLLCCKASHHHDKKAHSDTNAHWSTEHKKISSPSHHKSTENEEAKLHKKEEMLGQDMMRINEAEFKLQSLVSPEFHQGSKAINRGKTIGGMEVNTLSPEQVDFVQATSQWPKFSNPDDKKDASRTVYPEDPVLFPHERQRQAMSNNFDNNWITLADSFKQLSGSQYDMPMSNYGNMGSNMNNMASMVSNSFQSQDQDQDQPQQKATLNNMEFEVKPGYTTTGDAPLYDKMSSGMKVGAKGPLSFGGSSKNAMSALLNEGIMNPHGKPIGILGNILKASQEMPSGKFMKPSARSDMWYGTFSRRHKLERSQQNKPTHKHTRSSNLKHLLKDHKNKSKRKTQ